MSAQAVLKHAAAAGIHVAVEDDDLILEATAGDVPADLIAEARAAKPDLIALLRRTPNSAAADYEERAALVQYDAGVPREWAEGYARLCTMPRPPAFSPERWARLKDDGGLFLDAWAHQVAALGWTAGEVFGVNARAPDARQDGKGLVPLLDGWEVAAVAADRATVRNPQNSKTLSIYRRPDAEGRILLWEIGR